MIDTHAHIYTEEYDSDREEVIVRARAVGVEKIVLPAIDSHTLPRLLDLKKQYPDFFYAAIGLHPTCIDENYLFELQIVEENLQSRKWTAIGEAGIDLYWDKTFLKEQIFAFQKQIEWALRYDLPLIIHSRDAFEETLATLAPYKNEKLHGVFHSFGGTVEMAQQITDFGFYLGINGIVTFKNSGLAEVVKQIDLQHIIIETDAPYLTPTPYRGKRNESAYTTLVGKKIAEIYEKTEDEIDKITTANAKKLFNF